MTTTSIEDRLTWIVQRAGDHRETPRPVPPVTGEHPFPSLVEMNLDAVAVELDFMEPPVAGRAMAFSVASCSLMDPGIAAEANSATTFFARLATTLLKTSLKETRGFVMDRSFGNGCDTRRRRRCMKQ
jgi:hypothetical protein